MPASKALYSFVIAVLAIAATPVLAQQGDLEVRLREALRQATARSRALEDETAQLRARQAELEAELARLRQTGGTTGQPSPAALQQRIAELEQLFGEREKAFQGAVAEFNARLEQERQQALQIQEAGQRWRTAYEETARVARSKDAERQALARELEATSTGVADCAAKNRQLFAVGTEILDRYQGVGVGDVLARREPFIGLKRVELETLVQDYQDKLLDNRIDQAATPVPPAVAGPGAGQE